MEMADRPVEVAEHGKIVLPGDQVVHASALDAAQLIRVGTGLSEKGSGLVASRSGAVKVLSGKAGDVRVWVDGNARRYSPCVQVFCLLWVWTGTGVEGRLEIACIHAYLYRCTDIHMRACTFPLHNPRLVPHSIYMHAHELARTRTVSYTHAHIYVDHRTW